ncbi:ABC transporter CDR4 [Cyathus striatus]|nr:ABC transporter CDR4 [Cyathus striatus]
MAEHNEKYEYAQQEHRPQHGLPTNEAADSEVASLARTMTRESMNFPTPDSVVPSADVDNPFLHSTDPALDPLSGKFDPVKWAKNVLQLQGSDPEGYPRQTAAVSWSDLSVHGYGSSTDHQKTVGNYLLDLPAVARSAFGYKGERIDILNGFEGVLRESEMLLVLGRPGSGCTTFLKTLAGETHNLWMDDKSHINYQGISFNRMHKQFRGEVIYNAENDVHFPNLTVGQTLSFAARARTPRTRLPGVSREAYAEHMKDVVMAIFGLTHTLNTQVGDDFIRGVSGGERKRVSIAEVALSGSPLQCWDNSTRGLDSATALEFVKSVRMSSRYAGATAVVALYQASQNIYDVFDKVVVLYEGQQIYFGSARKARDYFVNMGFYQPPRQTTADFLTSLTNPGECRPRPGFEGRVPRTASEFSKIWRESKDRHELLREIEAFNREYPEDGEHLAKFKAARKLIQAKGSRAPYTLSVPMQIQLCLRRAWQRFRADTSNFITNVVGGFILSLIISSIFYNLKDNTASFYSRGALLFFAILMNAFAGNLEVLTIYAQRPIVEKHKRMALYHPYADAMATFVCDFPSKVISSLASNMVLYFMTNLRRTPGAFFTFYLFTLMTILVMSMIFRSIGASTRTVSQAMAPSAVILLGLVIYTGFTIPIRDMLGWSRWINYINPIAYAFESLLVNEFVGREFACSQFIPSGPGYDNVPAASRICATPYYNSHRWRNFGILWGYFIFFGCTYLMATEFISSSKSKGEVLVFRRGSVDDPIKKDEVAAIQKQTAIFHWEDVVYDIKIQGNLVVYDALDTLANRVTMGVVSGRMLVDGMDRDESFQRNTGYVHNRIPSSNLHLSRSEKAAYVEEIIHLLEMEKYADAVVGVPGEGLNVEQRKRLTIGVELVAKPGLLLFLDEPTSGLDSQTAWSICALLRKLANNGQAILCTIHQPSALLFQSFDRLLLLQKGGQTVYYGDIGENSRTLIDYFERQGADACPPDANPAEWMLSVIGAAPGAVAKRDYHQAWRESEELQVVKDDLQKLKEHPKPRVYDPNDKSAHSAYAAPFWTQLYHVTYRSSSNFTGPFVHLQQALPVVGSNILIGFSFFKANNTQQGLQNQILCLTSLRTARFMRSVNVQARHTLGKCSCWQFDRRVAWNTLAGIFLFVTWYYPIGLYRNAEWTHTVVARGGLMFLLIWQFMLFTSTFAHMLIAGVDSDLTGGSIVVVQFDFLFCGVLAGPSGLMRSRGSGYIFMYRLSPFTYIIDAMLSTAVANAPAFCSDIEIRHFEPPALKLAANATSDCQYCQITSTNEFLSSINSDYSHRWRNFGLLWVFIGFNMAMAVFFYWLARVPKGSRVKKE